MKKRIVLFALVTVMIFLTACSLNRNISNKSAKKGYASVGAKSTGANDSAKNSGASVAEKNANTD